MNRRMIKPLDISSLGGLRTDDFGQLVRCPSVLYHIADKYDKEIESRNPNPKHSHESDFTEQLSSDKVRKRLMEEMERHANKLRRRCELETYNARKVK